MRHTAEVTVSVVDDTVSTGASTVVDANLLQRILEELAIAQGKVEALYTVNRAYNAIRTKTVI